MRLLFCTSLAFVFSSCAHGPKCGNPKGARLVLMNDGSCKVRIRQVTIGTDLKIPASLKGPGLVNHSLQWVEPELQSGQIVLGHFVLVPTSKSETEKQ